MALLVDFQEPHPRWLVPRMHIFNSETNPNVGLLPADPSNQKTCQDYELSLVLGLYDICDCWKRIFRRGRVLTIAVLWICSQSFRIAVPWKFGMNDPLGCVTSTSWRQRLDCRSCPHLNLQVRPKRRFISSRRELAG